MTERWIIHIGTMKTGTTALQKTLLENRDIFLRSGLLYPESGLNHAKHDHFVWSCQFPKLGPRAKKQYNGKSTDELISAVNKEIEASRPRFCVLSAEDFSFFPPIQFKSLFDRVADYRVVVYLREQKALIESMYKQLVTFGGMASCFDDFFSTALDKRRAGGCDLDCRDLLDRWAAVVGKERLVVRTYAGNAKNNIVKDFFDAIGFEPHQPVSMTKANLSIEGAYLDFMRSVNEYLPEKYRRKLARSLKQLQYELSTEMNPGDPAARKRPFLSAEQAMRVEECFAASNRAIARRFFGRNELFSKS
jgi:hypothetical protein